MKPSPRDLIGQRQSAIADRLHELNAVALHLHDEAAHQGHLATARAKAAIGDKAALTAALAAREQSAALAERDSPRQAAIDTERTDLHGELLALALLADEETRLRQDRRMSAAQDRYVRLAEQYETSIQAAFSLLPEIIAAGTAAFDGPSHFIDHGRKFAVPMFTGIGLDGRRVYHLPTLTAPHEIGGAEMNQLATELEEVA